MEGLQHTPFRRLGGAREAPCGRALPAPEAWGQAPRRRSAQLFSFGDGAASIAAENGGRHTLGRLPLHPRGAHRGIRSKTLGG